MIWWEKILYGLGALIWFRILFMSLFDAYFNARFEYGKKCLKIKDSSNVTSIDSKKGA